MLIRIPAGRLWVFIAIAIYLGTLASSTSGQGVLVEIRSGPPVRLPRPIWPDRPQPVPQTTYRIRALEVNARLRDAVAQVQVSQTFENTGRRTLEAQFVFPLPYDGAIDQLTLLVDGKEYPAKLLPAEDARRRYEEIVTASRDPALLEWVGTGMYQTSVFPIPAGERRTVTLRYSQVCRTYRGLTDFLFPLKTAKYTEGELDKLTVRIAVESKHKITNVYSPSHTVDIDRASENRLVASLKHTNLIPTEDFRLFFDVGRDSVSASLLSYRPDPDEEGYFLLLATPRIEGSADEERAPKTVIFVVDRSGSMSGEKMEQAKSAAKFVIKNLSERDTFNIVAYDSEIEAFRPELEKFTKESREAALGFISGLYAGGSTNIDGALHRALGMLTDSERPAYVIFLTDGLPTVGDTGEASIVAATKKANKVRARVFTFGVGYDVNSRLLDKLARTGHGQSEYVKPEEDIEAAVSNLYRRIGAPVLTDASLTIDVEGAKRRNGPAASRVYPKGRFDLFEGDQAIFVGRYRESGDAVANIAGAIAGEEKSFSFPAEFVAKSEDDSNAFIAKIWASRRVGEIIDELDLMGRNEELITELVDLATRHGILTPYTSFLADDSAESRDPAGAVTRATRELSQLDEAEGASGVRQRIFKEQLRSTATASTLGVGGSRPMSADSSTGAPAQYGVRYFDAANQSERLAENIIAVGRKTFFRRGDRWVDSTVTKDEERAAEKIERFSQKYFELAATHGRYVAVYLAIEDPVVVKLDGKVYAW